MKKPVVVSALLGLGMLLGGRAWAGIDAPPADARKAVLAMREACTTAYESRVFRPQPACAPRRAALIKLGEQAVVAVRAELLSYVETLEAPPAVKQEQGQVALPQLRRRPANHGNDLLVGVLGQIATPAAVEALLDVITASGAARDPYRLLLPAHQVLATLTKANLEFKPRTQQDFAQVGELWRRWRAERADQQQAAVAQPATPIE